MRAVADCRLPNGIDCHQRTDSVAVRRDGGGRSEPPAQVGGRRAKSGAHATERKVAPCSVDGSYAEIAIRREHTPLLVATIEKVEQRCRRHDRYACGTDGKSAALLA